MINLNSELRLKNCFIAGGSILSVATKTAISDYDVYPKNSEGLIDAISLLSEGAYVINVSDRAITLKHNDMKDKDGKRAIIQIMTYDFFENETKIFDNFDFVDIPKR